MEIIRNGKVYFKTLDRYSTYPYITRKELKLLKKAGNNVKIVSKKPEKSYLHKFGNSLIDYNIGNFEANVFKKVGKGVKRVGKEIGRVVKKAVKKPLKSPLGIAAIAAGVYFGAPVVASAGASVSAGVSQLGSKLAQTATGLWWLNTGRKVLRVFKSKKGKVITQEIPKEQIPNADKLPSTPITETEAKQIVKVTPPFIVPSGIDVDEYNQLKSRGIDTIGIEKEYNEGESVKVELKDGKAKIIDDKLLPLSLLFIGGLYLVTRKGKGGKK